MWNCALIETRKRLNYRVITHMETGKVREFDKGQGKASEIRKSPGNCGLPVVCYCS